MKKISLGFGAGKAIMVAWLMTAAYSVNADPSPFGLEMGAATVEDMKAAHSNTRELGMTFLGGPAFLLNADEYENFQGVELAFDEAGKLANVTVQVYSDKWRSVLAGIRDKYKRSNFVFQKLEARGGKKYLAPHADGVGISTMFEDVFQDGDTIVYANEIRHQLTYFTLASHPKLAEAAAANRAQRLKKSVDQL
ncbi:hypothetical protein ACEK06_29305 [Pseudomonas brenneri]|uniref:hypothetical protein n=1 Tax=Pseudomonas brenneri TaxID=129817 RepID=UPI0035710616